jgi:hypothetical protein
MGKKAENINFKNKKKMTLFIVLIFFNYQSSFLREKGNGILSRLPYSSRKALSNKRCKSLWKNVELHSSAILEDGKLIFL